MSEELKGCPFCGREAYEDIDDNGYRIIKCEDCTAELECGRASTKTSEEAVKEWNTRAKPRLPRVKPEDLVEGKWYWCKMRYWEGIALAKNDSWGNKLTGTTAIWIGDCDYSLELFSAIWGPLPDYELETNPSDP